MRDRYAVISKRIFYAILGIFVLLVLYFAMPALHITKRVLLPSTVIIGVLFFLLGAALLFFTIKSKMDKRLRLLLILTGASAVAFLLSILMHNFIYGLFIYLFGAGFWERIGFGDEPFFFIVAVIVCPIVFLVGATGSMVLLLKKRK